MSLFNLGSSDEVGSLLRRSSRPVSMIGRFYSISNKSTKTIQVQLYTIAKKKRHEMHIFKGRVKGKVRNVMAAI